MEGRAAGHDLDGERSRFVFCFLVFIALLLDLQLPGVPSEDPSRAVFFGTVEMS